MSKPTEHPVVWSADEVNAALAGDKTQHRMILSSQPYVNDRGWQVLEIGSVRISDQCVQTRPLDEAIKKRLPRTNAAPYRIGDRLWVQEEHARQSEWEQKFILTSAHYFADGPLTLDVRHDAGLLERHPATNMPRWASRLLLEVINIRIERLNDISEQDAIAMGVKKLDGTGANIFAMIKGTYHCIRPTAAQVIKDVYKFSDNDDDYFKYGENPWVWVIEFKVIKPSEVSNG